MNLTKSRTKPGSEHDRTLRYLKDFSRLWFSPREVVNGLGLKMTDASLGRRFREDAQGWRVGIRKYESPWPVSQPISCPRLLIKRINKEGYAEYKWKRGGK